MNSRLRMALRGHKYELWQRIACHAHGRRIVYPGNHSMGDVIAAVTVLADIFGNEAENELGGLIRKLGAITREIRVAQGLDEPETDDDD